MEHVYGVTLAYEDETNKLVILSDKLFDVETPVTYITATEYAERHGKSRATVKKLCAEGQIGAL